MPFTSSILDGLFLFSVVVIWSMILYQLILTLFGYQYRKKIEQEWSERELSDEQLPGVSILIPSRNEEIVIQRTLERMLTLNFPKAKLEVVVINDGSTDNTGSIVRKMANRDNRISLIDLPRADAGSGKSHALNLGLQKTRHDLIAVYDADNHPEPDALKRLVMHLVSDEKLGAVIGKFRTLNRRRNLLTRFINVETLGFQWIIQAGRFHASQIAILPGTNCVIRKDVLLTCGGWDEAAITEDAELSVRIYRKGWKIKFVPTAVTWEPEPEKLRIWVRQRTRWVRGNNYVIRKLLKPALLLKNRFLSLEFLYLFLLYYLFLGAIAVSHLLFILCSLGVFSVAVPGPYTAVWISAFFMFLLEIMLVLSYEDEDSLTNIGVTTLMYFTYCQLWLYVVFRGLFLDMARKRLGIWDKTERTPQKDIPILEDTAA